MLVVLIVVLLAFAFYLLFLLVLVMYCILMGGMLPDSRVSLLFYLGEDMLGIMTFCPLNKIPLHSCKGFVQRVLGIIELLMR